jgi:hypothetical protein
MDKVHLKLPLADVDMGEKRLLKTSKLRQKFNRYPSGLAGGRTFIPR